MLSKDKGDELSAAAIIGIVLATALAGTLAQALIFPVLSNRGILDVPNHRSSHVMPAVRGGGIGVVVALSLGLALGSALAPFSGTSLQTTIWFGVTVLAAAALGWAEDVRGLSVNIRLGGQVLIFGASALCVMMLGSLSWGMAVLAWVGGVFYVNAANFMDGANGLSACHGLVLGAHFAVIGFVTNSAALIVAGLATATALLSFLPWNIRRARMFLGDVGSYALGAAVWGLCILALTQGIPLLAAVAPLTIYASDVTLTLLMRARRRAPLSEAHREHTYQRIHQITGSHGISAGMATSTTAACAGIGLIALQWPASAPWGMAALLLVATLYLATPRLLSLRRPAADPIGSRR